MVSNAVFCRFIGMNLSDKGSYIYNKGDEFIKILFFNKFFPLDNERDSDSD